MSIDYVFRLYVAGDAPNSIRARTNLAALVNDLVGGTCSVEEVDTLKEPMRALAERVLVTPTLIRVSPAPIRRIIGNLNEREGVINALELTMRQ